jgi:hypothetical protein
MTIQTAQTSLPIRSEDLHGSRLYESYGVSPRSPVSFESDDPGKKGEEEVEEDGHHHDLRRGGNDGRDRNRTRGVDSGVAFAV